MRDPEEIKRIISEHKKELEDRFKVKSIAIFGSYVRGDQNSDSDIDIIVEFKEPVELLFVHLAGYLEEIIGIKVDLLTPEAIKPNRRKFILKDLVYV